VLKIAVAAVLVAAALTIAMQPGLSGSPLALLILGLPYLVLSVLGILYLRREGTLGEKLRPKAGDLTFGALVTVMLFFGAIAGRKFFAPHGSVREAWVMRVYLQIGDPEFLQQRVLAVSIAVTAVALLEEFAWRGLIYTLVEERFGTRRAWPLTAVLYAGAHLPTILLLSDPYAGPNPLIVMAALGCGLVWGLIVARTGRLPVAMFSHALFTWCVAVQFPLWRLA
jgi:membrane protease YdiL (CAAX protease family)